MSQTESDLEKYRGTAGSEVKTADVASDDHALKSVIGDEEGSQERIYDPTMAGERFVQFYDDSAAAIREYLSNAETACIRRAEHELSEAGISEDEIPGEVSGVLDMAKEEAGYEPLIEVTYNRKSDETRLIIEDNGIGISTEEYQVVQRVGYSTSHDEGSRLGNFGMGWLSGFQLTSVNGMFKMSTKSRLTDEAYSTAEYVANFEMLDQSPDEYGTRFEFPSFGEAAKNIDIPSKVSEFADGMTIPVLYRDFDASGQETHRSDDFLATRMEDDYADDSMVIMFENEYFKAVMSPDSKENGRGTHTFNISMPIRRNTDSFGSNNKFNAKWTWDFRGKKEDGPIVHCPSDPSLVGLVPKEDTTYDGLLEDFQEKCVPMSRVPDDAVSMPEPASSRDSFKSGNDDFWKYVSTKLQEEWADVAKERFVELDSWQDFKDMERDEKEALFRAYSEFGPKYSDAEPETIQDELEDNLGVTIDKDLGMRLHESQSKVQVVSRGSNRAHTKGAAHGKQIWKVIDEAPDGVYMGVSVSQKKADIVWGLGDTHVVRVDSTDEYDEYSADWGWEKMKSLPSRKLAEKLPELSQDIIDRYDGVDASSSNNTRSSKSTGGNGQDPDTYRAKVRVGSNSRKYFTTWKVDNLVEKLEDGDSFSTGRYSCKYLIIKDDDTSARQTASAASRRENIAATRVPKYVYQYLATIDNVYESKQELYDDLAGVDVTLSDNTTMGLQELPSTDMLLSVGQETQDYFEDRVEDFVEILGYDPDDYDRFTFIDASDLDDSWEVQTDAKVIKTSGSHSFEDFEDYTYKSESFGDFKFEDRIGDMDKDSDEFEALFGYRYGEASGSTKETLIDIAQKAGLTE